MIILDSFKNFLYNINYNKLYSNKDILASKEMDHII